MDKDRKKPRQVDRSKSRLENPMIARKPIIGHRETLDKKILSYEIMRR